MCWFNHGTLTRTIIHDTCMTTLSSWLLTLFSWTSSSVSSLIHLPTRELVQLKFKLKLKVSVSFVVYLNLSLKLRTFHGLTTSTLTTTCIHISVSWFLSSRRITLSAQVLKSGWRSVWITTTSFSILSIGAWPSVMEN